MPKMLPIVTFEPRWVPERLLTELSMFWHTSATAVSGTYTSPGERRHKRRMWTANEFNKAHPELNISTTAVYKDVCDMLDFDGITR